MPLLLMTLGTLAHNMHFLIVTPSKSSWP